MAKRTKIDPTEEIDQFLRETAGDGVSTLFVDNPSWGEDANEKNFHWFEALGDVDEFQSKERLLALLRSDKDLPSNVRHHIADLLERYDLKRQRGKPRTPSYNRTRKQWVLEKALARVRADVRAGMTAKAAIEKNATEIGGVEVSENLLAAAYEGKLGAMRFLKRSRRRS